MITLLLTLFRGIASVILAMTLLDYYFALYAEPYDDGDGYMRDMETWIDGWNERITNKE